MGTTIQIPAENWTGENTEVTVETPTKDLIVFRAFGYVFRLVRTDPNPNADLYAEWKCYGQGWAPDHVLATAFRFTGEKSWTAISGEIDRFAMDPLSAVVKVLSNTI